MPEKVHVYAIVRVDNNFSYESAENTITVKEILPNLEEANQEVERLNKLNADKGCHYFCQQTRYYPEGRGITNESTAD